MDDISSYVMGFRERTADTVPPIGVTFDNGIGVASSKNGQDDRSGSRSRDHGSGRDRDRERDHDRDKDRDRKKRDRSRDRDRDGERSRDKDRERETERSERSDRDKERSERDKDRGERSDRDKDRSDRDKDRGERDKDRGERDKDRGERDKDRGEREKDRSERSDRDRDRSERDKDRGERDRHRESREADGDRRKSGRGGDDRDRRSERERGGGGRMRDSRERDRDSRSRRSNSRHCDDGDSRSRRRRSRSRPRRDRERSRSRSYERRRRDGYGGDRGGGGGRGDRDRSSRDRDRSSRDRDRSSRDRDRGGFGRATTMDRERGDRIERESKLDTIREEAGRIDLAQTIQDLIHSTNSAKNFASMFNCSNSNDSYGNVASENSQDDAEARKRRRKSRWGGNENDKTFIPGMPTILPSSLDPSQQEAYLVQLQIEEISRKLRTGDLGIPQNPEERSPSPEPIYSSDGKRLNTREFRFRKRLEEQRHQLIQKMQSVNPEFKPPADYKPPVTRVSDKVLIPQEEHPDINFVGLLIGPRGNTLKAMEKETGAKIIIRGKGSVKEGKVGRKDGQPLPGEDEPLHAFITAANPEAVKKAVDKIKDVIRQGIEVPEGHNDLRRMQLRELAQLNGTLRETDCQRCTNCGSTEHKSWLCPDKPNVTNSIVCTSCGGAGHISKDCRSKRPGAGGIGDDETEDSQAKIDEEYMSLMAELGEGPPPPTISKPSVDPLAQAHLNRGYSLFDKKPTQPMQAILAPPPLTNHAQQQMQQQQGSMHAIAPPPPIPPAAWAVAAANLALPHIMPPVSVPPNVQPPPPPMMPWMTAAQPPPPGGMGIDNGLNPPIPGTLAPPPPPGTGGNSSLQPPGTGPMPPLLPPPPPGTGSSALPPWSTSNTHYGGWGASTGMGGYMPPPPPGAAPPPPPCAPLPPVLSGLHQPPPPPPPSQ